MATKWNNTADGGVQDALEDILATVEQVQQEQEGEKESPVRLIWIGSRPSRAFRAAAGFLAFVLALSLMLGALVQTVGRLARQEDVDQWWKGDWQETPAFRQEVAWQLRDFLAMATGSDLDWWGTDFETSYVVSGYVDTWYIQDSIGGSTGAMPIEEEATATVTVAPQDSADLSDSGSNLSGNVDYQTDQNLLYRVRGVKNGTYYSNLPPDEHISWDLPEGYNFLLTFEDGMVSITKDGEAVDVYGDGLYTDDTQWPVPGYENFTVGEDVSGVTVYMAIREEPLRYLRMNSNGESYSYHNFYSLYRSIQNSQAFYRGQAIQFGVGLALLVVYLLLRKSKAEADQAVARLTAHVWTEFRVLAVCGCVLWLWMANLESSMSWYLASGWFGSWDRWSALLAGTVLGLFLSSPAALAATFWVVYLIVNDHRYTPKAARGSLLKAVTVRERNHPIQKRINRWNRMAAVLVCLPALAMLLALLLGLWGLGGNPYVTFLALTAAAAVAAILGVWLTLWRNSRAVRDVGRLTAQVEAVRAGDLTHTLDLPEDSDLRETAGQLNDIQAGMKQALAEQTRSERMKVELISNVSHDLKTPLTSILSYADLLRQEEDLPDHVRDYIRILDEKARRLSEMVQDVFDVSKAAADQLPVKPERLDLAKLLRQTLADMNEAITASGLTFRVKLPEETVPIVADGNRLYRVFQNLLQNALQYALPGSRVYLDLTTQNGRAEASLRNTSREELPSGVDFTARFVRGDKSRTDGGSGLGLSIAQSFTEACGGAFRIETVADLFTAVVTFPLAEEETRLETNAPES